MGEVKLFLDSGAFSAWSKSEKAKAKGEKGLEINIHEYIDFIKEHRDELDVYSVLDAIGDYASFPYQPDKAEKAARETWDNQKIMEKAGVEPLPCFHYGEPIKYLKRYIEQYDYIALGGMVPVATGALTEWLDRIFMDHLCDDQGIPKIKVHGFGMTSVPLMVRYPWYSVDSTSWVLTGRFGSIYVPRKKDGKYDYSLNSWKICVSNQSPDTKEADKHIETMSQMERDELLDYIHSKGYQLGESTYRQANRKTDKPGPGERWFNVENANHLRRLVEATGTYVPSKNLTHQDMIETVIEPGVSNEYKLRDEMNIIYFLDMEKSLPKWPWPFRLKKVKGFGFIGGK